MACVSGGPDSVFLLHALNHLKSDLGVTLTVANLDHGVRGEASEKDSDFVRKTAERLGLEYFHESIKQGEAVNKKLSKEENLREARYSFYKKAAKKLKANIVATGHMLDDNAETIVMRIVKGTSLKGLSGIPPVRIDGNMKIIRPLIETEKNDILDFLKKHNIPYRVDHTNTDEAFLRNRVRRKLLPYLSQYNPRIKFALTNMAESLRDDLEFMETEMSLKGDIVKEKKSLFFINLKDLVVQPKALQRQILKDALTKSGANIKKLGFRHWKDMREFLKFNRKGQAIDLPGDIRITREQDRIVFSARRPKKRKIKALGSKQAVAL